MKTGRFDHITDTQLLELFYADRDQKWIGILLERYTLLLFGLCMKYLKDEVEAKDCVQQIFLKVLTELPKYKVDYFKSWLYMVAKNQCLMKLRSKGGKEFKELREHLVADEKLDKESMLQDELTYQSLEEALKDLNEEQRVCITLFYLQKESYTLISERTGYSLLQVKSYIQNGKRNLKLMLQKKLKANKAN